MSRTPVTEASSLPLIDFILLLVLESCSPVGCCHTKYSFKHAPTLSQTHGVSWMPHVCWVDCHAPPQLLFPSFYDCCRRLSCSDCTQPCLLITQLAASAKPPNTCPPSKPTLCVCMAAFLLVYDIFFFFSLMRIVSNPDLYSLVLALPPWTRLEDI